MCNHFFFENLFISSEQPLEINKKGLSHESPDKQAVIYYLL